MEAIVSIEDLMACQRDGLGIYAMPYLSSRAETTASGDAFCSMRPVGFGWRNEQAQFKGKAAKKNDDI